MAGGAIVSTSNKQYGGKMTSFVLLACIMASSGGLIFGYDIGISGGVTSMDSFLERFFPSVYAKQQADSSTSQYCKFDSELLTLFTSSLYVAALIASFVASSVTRVSGRKWSMLIGGVTFLAGSALNGAASVPVYLSEMAPANLRGTLNIGFQFMITIGIFGANLINYGTASIKGGWGWRVSLGLAAVPAIIMSVGAFILPDTPNSLIERGYGEEARQMLQKIRGTDDVQEEYEDLVAASEEAKTIKSPWANILQSKYRPQLTMAILIPFFQQLTGINVIMFYAPVLFKTIGFGGEASLASAVITGIVNVFATCVSIATIVVGTLIALKFGVSGEAAELSKGYASFIVLFICVYVAAFAWSWGPLGWLVPSEIFPLEIRSAGQSITVSVNMFFTFVIAQVFLLALCHLKFGLFYFFAGWVVIMTAFIYFFLPETKNVPIEEIILVWKRHWFWGKFIADEDIHVGNHMHKDTSA
ncbi:hypothetical protein ZIOFF_042645 [Zingiber officinale]|uniref:Major facilitator superfamily (MFS) profile domain-containing protein n=1 Tax=Zingiber officinale TaxID=94328 RepID=A0A8J5G223_ZINOF|nr:hypothetical protein ZIOFF_042645 [Zingiber officinale]